MCPEDHKLYDDSKFQLIEEKPSFRQLVKLAKYIGNCENNLARLAEGIRQDVTQRVCDLLTSIDNLRELAHEICLIEIDNEPFDPLNPLD